VPNPETGLLLDMEGEFGASVGLANDRICRPIKHVGHHSESFQDKVGESSRFKIKRGQNAL